MDLVAIIIFCVLLWMLAGYAPRGWIGAAVFIAVLTGMLLLSRA